MKLKQILETSNNIHTFYKGMKESNFEKFKNHRIPGFLTDIGLALVYAEPRSTSNTEPVVVISTQIDINKIEDLRDEIDDMCGNWQNPKHPRCKELRGKVWFANSGGHGMRGIYYGLPVDNYQILFTAQNQEEFLQIYKSHKIQKMLSKHDYMADNRDKTWNDFL